MVSFDEARRRIFECAEPGETIEVPLSEAVGLVLAEPIVADVDSPPFDRAACDGFALRASDAHQGARLRVVGLGLDSGEVKVMPGHAAHLDTGNPMPIGSDAVLALGQARPDPAVGPPRSIDALAGADPGQNVMRRGHFLRAGSELAAAGTCVQLSMIGLLASQGCMHPVCYRRIRVAVLAVGNQLVGPSEAPIMHRERNAAGPTAVVHCLQWGATAHDLGTCSELDLNAALARAFTAPVVIVLGAAERLIARALARAGVESVFSGVAVRPGGCLGYGVVRGESGRPSHHVFHLPAHPIETSVAATLLVGPLIARLQGKPVAPRSGLRAVWDKPCENRTDFVRVCAVTLMNGRDGRWHARTVECRGDDDLAGFSRADALALLPPHRAPAHRDSSVEVAPFGPSHGFFS